MIRARFACLKKSVSEKRKKRRRSEEIYFFFFAGAGISQLPQHAWQSLQQEEPSRPSPKSKNPIVYQFRPKKVHAVKSWTKYAIPTKRSTAPHPLLHLAQQFIVFTCCRHQPVGLP